MAFTGAASAAAAFFFSSRRKIPVFSLALSISVAFFVSDIPTQKISWRPFNLVQTKDGLYGKLHLIKTSEQMTLYDNSFASIPFPISASAEESVHFALLQNPEARRVLLVGGGSGGSLTEILKYPRTDVDYVWFDPEIIRLSEILSFRHGEGILPQIRASISFMTTAGPSWKEPRASMTSSF